MNRNRSLGWTVVLLLIIATWTQSTRVNPDSMPVSTISIDHVSPGMTLSSLEKSGKLEAHGDIYLYREGESILDIVVDSRNPQIIYEVVPERVGVLYNADQAILSLGESQDAIKRSLGEPSEIKDLSGLTIFTYYVNNSIIVIKCYGGEIRYLDLVHRE